MKRTSFTFVLPPPQQQILMDLLAKGNYQVRPNVPYTRIAVTGTDFMVALYTSGKCLVQGKGAEDFVLFTLEPLVLKAAVVGYEEVLHPETVTPHMGSDESGKGDFFGPLVVCAAYVDLDLAKGLSEIGVRDCKLMTDASCLDVAAKARKLLGTERYDLVSIGPRKYNELYAKVKNVNRLLAWAHARCIENLLGKVPDCPRAVADQFGDPGLIERALMKNGKGIQLEQHHKAESDIAVAAASVIARASFLMSLKKLSTDHGVAFPKGCSQAVLSAAETLIQKNGPQALLTAAKCHFRTTDQVLEKCGCTRRSLAFDSSR